MRKFVIVTLGAVSMAGGLWIEASSAKPYKYTRKELQESCDTWGGNFMDSPGHGYGCAYGTQNYVGCGENGDCDASGRVLPPTKPPTKYGAAAGQGAASTKDVSGNTAGSASGAGRTSGAASANSNLIAAGPSTSKATTKTAPVIVSTTIGGGGGSPATGRPGLRQQ